MQNVTIQTASCLGEWAVVGRGRLEVILGAVRRDVWEGNGKVTGRVAEEVAEVYGVRYSGLGQTD